MHFQYLTTSPLVRRGRWLAVGLLTASVLGTGVVGAQARGAAAGQAVTFLEDFNADGTPAPPVAIAPASGFNLFAQEDIGFAGMRMTGDVGHFVSNQGGPCPYYFNIRGGNSGRCYQSVSPVQSMAMFFGMGFLAGAPIHEYRKIRAVHPGVANMLPPVGYTAPHWYRIATPNSFRWDAADGQFGFQFSGVTSTTDATCRNYEGFGNGFLGNDGGGLTSLAVSDCPETWPAAGFLGKKVVPDSVWQNRFAADPNGFRWDDWKIPASATADEAPLGDVGTYGFTSDYYREQLAQYGAVTPRGTGAPSLRGYPLGLEIKQEVWQFARPSLRNVVFHSYTIVNNSADVYGAGIDYDSLYFGMDPGVLYGGANGQSSAWYFDFNRNAVILAKSGTSGRCSTTFPRRVPTSGALVAGGCTNGTIGFSRGATALVWLKSPLGDTRNKLFTSGDPETNPYFNPSHPSADDTITYNHAKRNGFGGGGYNTSFLRSDRAIFGYLSSTEDNFFDGRTLADFTPGLLYAHFQSERLAEFNGAPVPEIAKFNKFVPSTTIQTTGPNAGQLHGAWDYNNDGIPDSISVPGCGVNGCAVPFSDSLSGGTAPIAGNIGNTVSAGPFALAAGDTTQMIWAYVFGRDSLQFEATLNNTINAYLNNYAGASPVPPPVFSTSNVTVTTAGLRDSLFAAENTQITINIPQPNIGRDAFINSVYERMVRDSASPTLRRILNLNPGILEAVDDRARNNFSELMIFFSCNGGVTFSTGTACTPAEARLPDGSDINSTFGWRPIVVRSVDSATGRINNPSITINVPSGRRYLFSFVTRTRGLIDIPVIDSIDGRLASTNLGAVLFVDADTINSSLFRSGPNVVDVYAPVQLPAGRVFASLDTATTLGRASQPLDPIFRDQTVSGRFEKLFGNRFIRTEQVDTVTNQVVSTQVIVERVLSSARDLGSATVVSNLVARADTFAGTGPVAVTNAGGLIATRTRTTASGSIVTFVDTFTVAANSLGYLFARENRGAPLHIATSSTAPAVDAFLATPSFPGFAAPPLPVESNNGIFQNVTVRGEGDTLITGVVNTSAVRILPESQRPNTGRPAVLQGLGGKYELTWAGDPWGPQAPFRLGTPLEMQAAVDASLSAVPRTSFTDASEEIRTLVDAALPAGARDLVRASLPFTIQTPSGGEAILAMRERPEASNTRLLGTFGDTVRVGVPADQWMPGDTLFLIETLVRDSVEADGVVVVKDTTIDGKTFKHPVQTTSQVVSFTRLFVSCASNSTPARNTCNPIALGTRGATGYLPLKTGWKAVFNYRIPFNLFSTVSIVANPVTFQPLTAVDMERVRVVPNPYIVQSTIDDRDGARTQLAKLLFTGVPSEGTLRIYSVSGQLLQQITWTPQDLTNIGLGQLNGDLPYNLRTREGLELGSGLYLYVLTAGGPNANGQVARGKFVVIR